MAAVNLTRLTGPELLHSDLGQTFHPTKNRLRGAEERIQFQGLQALQSAEEISTRIIMNKSAKSVRKHLTRLIGQINNFISKLEITNKFAERLTNEELQKEWHYGKATSEELSKKMKAAAEDSLKRTRILQEGITDSQRQERELVIMWNQIAARRAEASAMIVALDPKAASIFSSVKTRLLSWGAPQNNQEESIEENSVKEQPLLTPALKSLDVLLNDITSLKDTVNTTNSYLNYRTEMVYNDSCVAKDKTEALLSHQQQLKQYNSILETKEGEVKGGKNKRLGEIEKELIKIENVLKDLEKEDLKDLSVLAKYTAGKLEQELRKYEQLAIQVKWAAVDHRFTEVFASLELRKKQHFLDAAINPEQDFQPEKSETQDAAFEILAKIAAFKEKTKTDIYDSNKKLARVNPHFPQKEKEKYFVWSSSKFAGLEGEIKEAEKSKGSKLKELETITRDNKNFIAVIDQFVKDFEECAKKIQDLIKARDSWKPEAKAEIADDEEGESSEDEYEAYTKKVAMNLLRQIEQEAEANAAQMHEFEQGSAGSYSRRESGVHSEVREDVEEAVALGEEAETPLEASDALVHEAVVEENSSLAALSEAGKKEVPLESSQSKEPTALVFESSANETPASVPVSVLPKLEKAASAASAAAQSPPLPSPKLGPKKTLVSELADMLGTPSMKPKTNKSNKSAKQKPAPGQAVMVDTTVKLDNSGLESKSNE